MTPVYEVVRGKIKLSHRGRFYDLHGNVLLPKMKALGIRPRLLMVTEIGVLGEFLDVYEYENLMEYERLTDKLINDPTMPEYYEAVGDCIYGSIEVRIMTDLPYSKTYAEF